MNTGIYCIRNLFDGKEYVGSSSVSITRRWRKHRLDLKLGMHHSYLLQRAWNACGESAFEFSVLEECPPDRCLEREQYFMDTLDPEYNVCHVAGSPLMVSRTLASRAKMSEAQKGNKNRLGYHTTPATKARISAANKGRVMSPEATAKGVASRRGYVPSQETRAKISSANKGRPKTPDHRARLSASAMGRIPSPETRAKISASLFGNKHLLGYHHTDETKLKMRRSHIGRPHPHHHKPSLQPLTQPNHETPDYANAPLIDFSWYNPNPSGPL